MIQRRRLLFGFSAAAALLMLSSAAFACTIYKGKMTVTPNGRGSSGSSSAIGNGSGMGYCAPVDGDGTLGMRGGTVTVRGGPAPGGGCGGHHVTGQGEWFIRWIAGKWDPNNGRFDDYMFSNRAGSATIGGPFHTNNDGTFGPFTSNFFDPPPGDVGICFTKEVWYDSAPQVPIVSL